MMRGLWAVRCVRVLPIHDMIILLIQFLQIKVNKQKLSLGKQHLSFNLKEASSD